MHQVSTQSPSPSDIAIVGMSVLLPGAQSPGEYWTNILRKTNSITEIPARRWDWHLHYDEDRAARDKVYSKWGGFLDEVSFDPLAFGIPPTSLKSIEPMQLLALEATRRALNDAGYENGGFNKETTSVIFGVSGGLGDMGQQLAARSELPRMLGAVTEDVLDRLPEWTGESFPGLLFNVVTGRIANRFDLGGSNYTVDAACASSLAALDQAVRELETGVCDVALAGGVDTMQSVFGYMCFSKTQALSPSGVTKTFDEEADGIVLSEGVGVLVLKRLADAERDGDRIYAVIKAMGSSSDGRGSSLTSPTNEGQMRAMRRAYSKAGISPATVGLYEAHGTGTTVGDTVELNSYCAMLTESAAEANACVVGSVKTLIGHTKATAGVVGMAKVALALHHKVLPAHHGVENPLPNLRDRNTPVCLVDEAVPWIGTDKHPRRAAVSSFGFGGTNTHAILEEAANQANSGADAWPFELFTWTSPDREKLAVQLENLEKNLEASPHLWRAATMFGSGNANVALAIVAESSDDLISSLRAVLNGLRAGGDFSAGPNVFLRLGDQPIQPAGKLAFLFPGQGSQYPNPARETALFISEIREAVAAADGALDGELERRLSQFIYAPRDFSTDGNKSSVSSTRIAQPLIGTISCGYLDFLRGAGIEPDMVAGHSYGEFTALHAAGVISREDFLRLSALRGRTMGEACDAAPGAMAAVMAPRAEIAVFLAGTGVLIANHNSPNQCVITGARPDVEAVLEKLTETGISTKLLPVSGAFHSPLMNIAQMPLREAISALNMTPPKCPVFSNSTGDEHSHDPAKIRENLCGHLLSTVEFVREIESMYAAGARIFLEVGPRTILTSLAQEILKQKPDAVCLGVDGASGSLRGLLRALGRLHVEGVDFDKARCHAAVDSRASADLPSARESSWRLDGGCIRKLDSTSGPFGLNGPLTSEDLANQRSTMNTDPKPQPNTPAPEAQIVALHAYSAYQETMRQFLKVQEQVMGHFLGGTPMPALSANLEPVALPSLPTPALVVPKEEAPKPAASAANELNRDTLTSGLLGLVSEHTGYPTDMLGLEQDVEADLGIDSIKRVEIFVAFQKQLPAEVVTKLKSDKAQITRIRTLKGWIDAVMNQAA